MRIALETSTITSNRPTGIARYGVALMHTLQQQLANNDSLDLVQKISKYKKRKNLYRSASIDSHYYLPALGTLLKRYDILHSLDAYLPSWPGHTKKVITMHDLFVLLHDDVNFCPESFRRKRIQKYQKIKQRADAFIAVSESTKQDMIRLLDIEADKIHVTHLGIAPCFQPQDEQQTAKTKQKYQLPDNYLIYVGNISLRKNTDRLVQAFNACHGKQDVSLVLVGSVCYKGDITLELIDSLGLDDRVKIIGYADDADLPALYSGAQGMLFPTLYEGFGIPILEAMACGTPVLAGNKGAAPEVCNGHGVLVDPYDVTSIASGIDQLLACKQTQRSAAIEHSKQFTWERCAQNTIKAYQSVLAD